MLYDSAPIICLIVVKYLFTKPSYFIRRFFVDDSHVLSSFTDINGNPVTFSGATTKSYVYKRSGKCEASLYYVLDGIKVPNDEEPYVAVDSLENGKHIITVSYLFRISQPKRYILDIYMNANGGTITIEPSGLQASLMGQEIDEVEKWDGNLIIDNLPQQTYYSVYEQSNRATVQRQTTMRKLSFSGFY